MAETSNEWEVAQFSRALHADNWREWPENNRLVAQAAVDRFLKQNPGVHIVSDTSFCMLPTHPRWPELDPDGPWSDAACCLVRQIRTDHRIPVGAL